MSARFFTDEEAIEAIKDKNNVSIRMVLRKLRDSEYSSSNYKLINKIVDKYKLDVSHWKGHAWNSGLTGKDNPRWKSVKFWLVKNGKKITSWKLKQKLFAEGVKEKQCEKCKITHWNGEIAPLELDHINGDKRDNRLENLRILCPNCHAQTPTYRTKNWK